MPALEYFLVCRSISRDMFTDDVTLTGVLEDVDLNIDGFGFIPSVVAVGSWNIDADTEGQDQDIRVELKITRPEETEPVTFPMKLTRGRNRYRGVFAIEGIPLPKPGVLTFEVLVNALHSASHRVFVHPAGVRLSEPLFGDGELEG